MNSCNASLNEIGFSAKIVRGFNLSREEINEWQKLSTAVSFLQSPFFSSHFTKAVSDAGVSIEICLIYQNGALVAFFPYQFRNALHRMFRAAEPIGAGMSDYSGLIGNENVRIAPDALIKLADLNYFGFDHLHESQLVYGLTGEQPRIGLQSVIQPSPEEFINSLAVQHKKYLQDGKRLERRLNDDVGVIRVVVDEVQHGSAQLENLIRHKRAQYLRTNAPDSLSSQWKRDLLKILLQSRHKNCTGVLSTLYAGDIWVASHFGILGNGIFQYWFPVYNSDYSKYAPGRILNMALVRQSPELGFTIFDRGEGDSDDKRKSANKEHLYYKGSWHNQSLRSVIYRALLSLKWRVTAAKERLFAPPKS